MDANVLDFIEATVRQDPWQDELATERASVRLRSLLFVPGHRLDQMQKALGLGADALILDLEDAVAPNAKPGARATVARFLAEADRKSKLFVRVNPFGGNDIDCDLRAIAAVAPDGIVFPKAAGPASVRALVERMSALGLAAPVLAITNETPASVFQLGDYGAASQWLCGLTWGAQDLAAAIGAVSDSDDSGLYTAPFQLARSLTLFGARAANTLAIETVFPAFRDLDGLERFAAAAMRDGFTGMMAIHPGQVEVINRIFTPSAESVEHARAVLRAFEASSGTGALQLDGVMIDAPHLKQAMRLLERYEGVSSAVV